MEPQKPEQSHPFPLPTPPYWMVIFSSVRQDNHSPEYAEVAQRMDNLARTYPGFLAFYTVRQLDGPGISISYWQTEEDLRRWKADVEHLEAQRMGREQWYAWYRVEVGQVLRAYESRN